jgi:hypothetical protein
MCGPEGKGENAPDRSEEREDGCACDYSTRVGDGGHGLTIHELWHRGEFLRVVFFESQSEEITSGAKAQIHFHGCFGMTKVVPCYRAIQMEAGVL